MVLNTVLMSDILHILPRSTLTPATYERQMVYFGSSSGCLSLLGAAADLMMWSG